MKTRWARDRFTSGSTGHREAGPMAPPGRLWRPADDIKADSGGRHVSEYRRILLDGAAVEVRREGDELVAGDGRRVTAAGAAHLPPVVPTKIVAVHLNHHSRVAEF